MAGCRAPLVINVGTKLTSVDPSRGLASSVVRFVRHGPVVLAASQAAAARGSAGAVTRLIRAAGEQVVERAHLDDLRPFAGSIVGAGGGAAVITLAGDGWPRATAGQIRAVTEDLAAEWLAAAHLGRPRIAVESMMVGAAVLGSILDHLGAQEISVDLDGSSARRPQSD